MAKDGKAIMAILPSGVAAVERFGDQNGELLGCERSQVGTSTASRQAEFAAGRSCAREALSKFGIPPMPIPTGKHREPIWPSDFVGSITHCRGYCAAAVGKTLDFAGIGIDAELNNSLPPSVLKEIASPSEWEWIRTSRCKPRFGTEAPDGAAAVSGTLLFSAKESLFKAWFCVFKRWLGFDEVALDWFPDNKFAPRPLSNNAEPLEKLSTKVTGRYLVRNDLILTSVVIVI